MMKFLLFYVLIYIIVLVIGSIIAGVIYGRLLVKASIKYDLELQLDSCEDFFTLLADNASYIDSFHEGSCIMRLAELYCDCKYDVLRRIIDAICAITGIYTIIIIYDSHKMCKHFDDFIEFLLKEAEKESQNEESE